MIKLYFEKLANFDRVEPVCAAIPFKKGIVDDVNKLVINDGQKNIVSQNSVTAKWNDGSVKWALIKFFAELKANKDKSYFCDIKENCESNKGQNILITQEDNRLVIDNGKLIVKLNNNGKIFNYIKRKNDIFLENDINGFLLNNQYEAIINELEIIENGSISAIVEGKGKHVDKNGNSVIDFVIDIQFFKDCDWFKIDYRIINKEQDEFFIINSLELNFNKNQNCHLISGRSNYRTAFIESDEQIYDEITANDLVFEANEHFPEVFYGTFFGDLTDKNGGISATIYQAQQNFPKAFELNKNQMKIQLVPANGIDIEFGKGMAKTHTIFIHLHDSNTSKEDINLRSLQLQMMDRPIIDSEVFKNSSVFPDLYLDKEQKIYKIENVLTKRMDARGKAYGILHWGDSADMHYTEQGRGNGKLVWTNNEYDFPHTTMLMYSRSPLRRYIDYLIVGAKHWKDIDVCHYSQDPIRINAQIIHSAGHTSGKVEISHEWVEGLFDYYHISGDRDAYNTAIEIGNNIKRNLALPKYHKDGEINARETGWALRALVALYVETNDESWLEDADFIVGHFENWEKKYGGWLAPYTDHTLIRVPFMISIAVGSLMRYYNIRPNDKIRNMILNAVDDMVENCLMENGLFYYKEIPSLKRMGNNTIVLEALVYAYNFTGDKKYLEAGMETFRNFIFDNNGGSYTSSKKIYGDAVVIAGAGSKGIAQAFYPVTSFYVTAVRAGINLF